MVLAWAAYWRMWHVGQGWTDDPARDAGASREELCLRAIKIDPDNAEALGIYAHTCSWKKDFDTALHYFDRALRSNPNLAFVWALSAITHCYIGKPSEALKRMERYRELAPFDPYFCFFESIYCDRLPDRRRLRGGAHGRPPRRQGQSAVHQRLQAADRRARPSRARSRRRSTYVEKVLDARAEIHRRAASAKSIRSRTTYDRDRYCEGLRLAGVPEG